jgi:REP element-mobilizing transposase RayT
MVRSPVTIRFTHRKLPHWEVESGRYFITVRCADSLPRATVLRLQELHRGLGHIAPRSPEFAAEQRRLFQTMEKYLDAGLGSCPLRRTDCARIVTEELAALVDWDVSVMPNHWHALLIPGSANAYSLSAIMKRVKGRTAKRIRTLIGGQGAVWQGEWFDRWVRDEAEWNRIVTYIQNNPVKAGLAGTWSDHPWTR